MSYRRSFTSFSLFPEPDDLELEADAEFNKLIDEITSEIMAPAGTVPTKAVSRTEAGGVKLSVPPEEDSSSSQDSKDPDLSAMQARLGSL